LFIDNSLGKTNTSVQNNTVTIFRKENITLGSHIWNIECEDSIGKVNSTSRVFSINDTGAPAFFLDGIATPTADNTPTLPFNITDLTGVNTSLLYMNLTNSSGNTSQFNTSFAGFICSGPNTFLLCNLTLSSTPDGVYNLTFFAEDTLGNTTIANITGYRIDSSPPVIISITDNGNIVDNTGPNSNNITAEIIGEDNETPIIFFNVSLGTESDQEAIDNFTIFNASLLSGNKYFVNVSFFNRSLTDEIMYFVYASAINNVSSTSSIGSSDGVLFDDNTGPTTPNVVDSGVFATSNTVLSFNWSATDAQSGIAFFEVQLNSSNGGPIIFTWTNVGTNTSGDFTGSFDEGTNFSLYVRATSNSAHISSVGRSDGIVIDTISPVNGSIDYTNGYEITETIQVNVTIGNDSVSGIESAVLNITKSELIGNVCNAAFQEDALQVLNLSDGLQNVTLLSNSCYQFDLVVTDIAGNIPTTYDSGNILKLDTDGPSIYTAVDLGDSFSNKILNFTLVGKDLDSNISQFNFSVTQGATFNNGATPIFNWTVVDVTNDTFGLVESDLNGPSFTFTNGQIYFINVQARNNAGIWSAINASDGIIFLDETAPNTSSIYRRAISIKFQYIARIICCWNISCNICNN